MSRLPELERELRLAARRLEAPARRARRWPQRLLLVAAAALTTSGMAWAAAGLLSDGAPVPRGKGTPLATPDAGGFTVAAVRVPDPEGGPEWGIGTYDASLGQRPGTTSARRSVGVRCVVVARVQAGRLGVVGRDGAFANDGRFHRLVPGASFTGGCSGVGRDGSFVLHSSAPPTPASGYSGAPGPPIGGCRERVDLDGPTVSKQTRRKLRGVPMCAASSLRRVVAGYAGARAVTATITVRGRRVTQRLRAEDDGAFLFVLPGSTPRPELMIAFRDGSACWPHEIGRSRSCFRG